MRPKPSRVRAFKNCLGTIWSVSTLTRSSGITRPVCVVKGSILQFSLDGSDVPFANVDEMAGDGSGCGHHRADQMRPAVAALAALEIAIRGAGAALMRWEHVRVHADAHAASGVAPFEARRAENFVQAFLFGL